MNSSLSPTSYRRGQVWLVDFGNPMGSEFGMEHPAVIVSHRSLLNTAQIIGHLIVVPGTSTRFERNGELLVSHQEVQHTPANGLDHTTYFMAEHVRSLSVRRLRRLAGQMELAFLKQLDDRLCLVLDLFQPGSS